MEKRFLRRLRRLIFLKLFNLLFSRITSMWSIKRFVLKLANVQCGPHSKVVGPLVLGNAVVFSIGDYVWLGQDFKVYGSGTCRIGDRCDIGPDVTVLSGSHSIGTKERRAGKGCHYTTEVGNGVWIGGRCTLFGNIKIGDSSIIAAGAVVNSNVCDNTIAGGVPAKVIKQIID